MQISRFDKIRPLLVLIHENLNKSDVYHVIQTISYNQSKTLFPKMVVGVYMRFQDTFDMQSLSCLHDSRNDNYVLYHLALLVFVLTIMIPINLHLTKLPLQITSILFAVGFLSLFMIARNEKIGLGLLKFMKIGTTRSPELLHPVNTYESSSKKIQHSDFNSYDIYEDPIVLLQNFVDDLSRRHKENMDWETLDSFRRLSDRVSQLVEVKAYDE